MQKFFTFIGAVCLFISTSQATTRTSIASGNWNSTSTWSGGTIPLSGDDVVISSGNTVTINVSPANTNNLTISGTLQFDATGTARTYAVTATITINSGGIFNCTAPGTATTHTLTFSGTTFINNGAFNMVNSTNKCNVVISGTSTQTVSGNAMTFNKLSINNTGGQFQIVYGSGFTLTEVAPTKFQNSITTNDSLVIQRGMMIAGTLSNGTQTLSVANFKMGSSTSKYSSSVDIFSGAVTVTVNTGFIVNDATNDNVAFTINNSFVTPNMTQSNSGTAMAMIGPNCQGGANNATTFTVNGVTNIPDLFGLVGNSKLFGGVEPKRPIVTFNGNVFLQYSKSFVIDIPFTSQDITIKTFYFGRLDTAGVVPLIQLNGGTVAAPNQWNVVFHVWNAPLQSSTVLGTTLLAQISNSLGNWVVNGNWSVTPGNSLAVHSDDTLNVKGTLRTKPNGEIAGTVTGTTDTSYISTNGPLLLTASNSILYCENAAGLGNGVYADTLTDKMFKNRTADINWNLSAITSNGKVDYNAASAQTITNRTYNKLSASGGVFIKTMDGATIANDSLMIASSTTLADGGFNLTAKKSVTNNGTHSGTGKIILGGSANQSLGGSGIDWGNVQLNNSAGATCNGSVSSSGNIDFTSGILTTSSANKLSLTSSGTYSNSGTSSFVNGPMSKTTNSTSEFIFPVGKGSSLRTASIIPAATASNTWTVEYFNSAYTNTTSLTAPLTSVSTVEYWEVDRNSGSSQANVKLTWNAGSGLTDTLGNRASRWTGTAWTDAGAIASTGNASSGSVTSAAQSSFNTPFTLGEANGISTSVISGSPFCPGAAVSVPFTSYGTFKTGNVYTAQLSSSAGKFTSPATIGTLSSTANSGTINGTIPTSSNSGTKYRIRVISSNPSVTGTDNGTNLTISTCDAPTGLNASGITSSAATIGWNSVTCAFNYTLQYRVQGTTTWTKKKNLTGNSKKITGLTANTIYEYEMQTICTSDSKSKSSFTAIQTFTTVSARMEDEATAFTVNVFPNPATDQLMVKVENVSGNAELLIRNAIGQVVLQTTVANELNAIDISALPSGIYFLHIISNGSTVTQKFVKQ